MTVAAPTEASLDDAWGALTEPGRVEQWFGSLSGPLSPGARLRLDFADGDFFDLDVERVAKPVLRWTWRFMGCGPRDVVEVRVDERDGSSVVTVTDREPNRSGEEALELAQGWRDFTTRLQSYLATRERARYDWRSDVDVVVELPVDADAARRIAIGLAAAWLPLEAGAENLVAADAIVLSDGEEPAAFAITGLEGAGPASVRFELRPEGIDGSLPTEIAVAPRGEASTLAISQTGFRGLPTDETTRRRTRERFAAAWVTAARRAAELAQRARNTTEGSAG